jgi:phosphoribosylglycinamide formyltransferase-1
MVKIGVLGSGKGSNFVAICEAIERGELNAQVVLVGSDHYDAGILRHAARWHLPVHVIPRGQYKTKLEPEHEEALAQALIRQGAEWVVLAGYMRVVKEPLLRAFPDHIINIHPSLLPKYPGLKAWLQALQAGETVTGCTVHLVNDVIDGGKIIAQEEVAILPSDSPETLHARIQEAEHRLFPQTLERLFYT